MPWTAKMFLIFDGKKAIMNQGETIFSQLTSFFPKYEFDKCVERYKGNYKVIDFTCWQQFLVMSFARSAARRILPARIFQSPFLSWILT